MNLHRPILVLTTAVLLASCGGGTTQAPVTTSPEVAEGQAAEPAPPVVQRVVRVTTGGLNVRRDPTMTAEVIAQVKKGERLTVVATTGTWSKVLLPDGMSGWVASQYVTAERGDAPPKARRRRGCAPDSDFSFIDPPKPRFSDLQSHGLVVIDVNVDAKGRVTATRVISNTTGADALAALTVEEIRSATFAPPVRNCVPKAFIYTYKRSF